MDGWREGASDLPSFIIIIIIGLCERDLEPTLLPSFLRPQAAQPFTHIRYPRTQTSPSKQPAMVRSERELKASSNDTHHFPRLFSGHFR